MSADDHRLSEQELDGIFERSVAPTLFGRVERSTDPLLILTGAQPGAGKTRAGMDAIAASGQTIVRIIGDDLRKFHPEYLVLLSKHPAAMPDATAQAMGGWVERSARYAADHRVSTLIEGTWRDPTVPMATAQMFSDAGFKVDAHLIAVSPEESHLSTGVRFVEDDRRTGEARFTKVESHDEAFDVIPLTMRAIAAVGSPMSRLVVRTRERVLFDRSRNAGRTIRGGLSAARQEWNRPQTDKEFRSWMSRAEDVTSYLDLHHAGIPEVADLVRQLGYDGQYIGFVRSGSVAVRGHVRAGGDVVPHVRSWPRSSS